MPAKPSTKSDISERTVFLECAVGDRNIKTLLTDNGLAFVKPKLLASTANFGVVFPRKLLKAVLFNRS